jgi:hypothetical protein
MTGTLAIVRPDGVKGKTKLRSRLRRLIMMHLCVRWLAVTTRGRARFGTPSDTTVGRDGRTLGTPEVLVLYRERSGANDFGECWTRKRRSVFDTAT